MSLDSRHAAYVGWVLGIARRHLAVRVIVDDDGSLTAGLLVQFPNANVMLIVPAPPPNWLPDLDQPSMAYTGYPCGTCGTVLVSSGELARHLEGHARVVERGGSLDDLPGASAARRAPRQAEGGLGTPPARSGWKPSARRLSGGGGR